MSTSFTANTSSSSADPEFIIADICEDYFDRRERGESPSLEEYTQRFPALSGEIRETLQALMLVNASSELSDAVAQSANDLPEIPGFALRAEVGRGAVGVVYDAVQISDQSRVAIKVLKAQGRFNLNLQERFLREAAVSARLEHPHIVRCIGSGRAADDAYMTMEFIDGHNFHEVLECLLRTESENPEGTAGPVDCFLQKSAEDLADYRKLAGFGADIASALSYAHDQRVIHRDIKPANLIVDLNGKAWVADFGLAKMFNDDDNLSRTGDMVGTPRYMAPEQVRGVCSAHSDIYALGVTLYEFAVRQRAWQSVARNQLLTARVSMELPDITTVNPDVPPGLAKIITKACAFDPANRYESAKELETVLRRFAAGKSNADRRNRERLEEDTFVRRKSIVITGGIIAGLTAAAVLLATGKQEQPPAVGSAEEVLSLLSNDQALQQAIDALPESPDDDTLDKVITRHVTAARTQSLVDQKIDEFVVNKNDRQELKAAASELLDSYKKSTISPDDARETANSIHITLALMKIGLMTQRIKDSRWPDAPKRFGMDVCKELSVAVNKMVLSEEKVSALKALISSHKQNGEKSDRALQHFVKQSWSVLNAIPRMPPGSPTAPERLEFINASRGLRF